LTPPANPLVGSSRAAVARRWSFVVLILAFLLVLMPFLFWRSSWLGRPLSDEAMDGALADTAHPRNIQHALSQIADRILRRDPIVKRWYPQVAGLASSPVDQIRLTAAWVMGQDNSVPEFHEALLRLLDDPQPMVRSNAALALVRFGDPSGRPAIVAMLRPFSLVAPEAGKLSERLKVGDVVNPGTLVGRLEAGGREADVRSTVPGTLEQWLVANGTAVAARQEIVRLAPSPQAVWEALRGLYLLGQPEDLPAVLPYARGAAGMPARVQQQAQLTALEIQSRSGP
jgi:biotin carboxyl carrier protein